ncbi:hypothetical protein GZH47_32680 (plasmid) [Paenibacillus rhizovicinus]|uniref:Uncharacterized protein n=1 Tax=Paenibacillus rhizovicinus TaxID=2704463 RepID=A0A6C0PB43_9BACL|nr:hypothetical protein [Paenibacillus rhizovicinus]QHW35656.1 hypothetical protein GZH47_32680 [Paenibacillus rhizovicinus]
MPEDQENQFSAYLDRDTRPMSRFLASEDERQEMPMLAKVGIGVGIGAIAMTLAHRTGGMRRMAQFIEVQGKAARQAAEEVAMMDGRGMMNVVHRNGEFRERYRTNVQERAEAMRQGTHREYDMQRIVRQMNNFVDREIPSHIEEGMRFNAIMDDLRSKHGLSEDTVNKVTTAFHKRSNISKGNFSLKYAHDREIRATLAKHGGIEDKSIQDAVIQARAAHRNFNVNQQGQQMQARVDRMQRKFRDLAMSEMHELTRKQGGIKEAIRGHRQATIDDILELNSSGRMKIDTDTKINLERIRSNNQKFGQAVFDEHLYVRINADGKAHDFFDYKTFDDIKERTMEWWSPTIFGGIGHVRDVLNARKARRDTPFRMFNRGGIQPILNAQRGLANNETLKEEAMYFNGRFYNLFDNGAADEPLEILNKKRKVRLTSSQFGTQARMVRATAGMGSEGKDRNLFKRIFDLGDQNKDTTAQAWFSVAGKFFNPEWERNMIDKAVREGVDYKGFFKARGYFEKYTSGFSPRVLNQIQSHMPQHIQKFVKDNNINFNRDDDMLKLFEYLGNPKMKVPQGNGAFSSSNSAAKGANEGIRNLWRQFDQNREGVLGRINPIGEANLLAGEYTRVQTGMDQINQQVSLELIRQMMEVKSGPKQGFRDLMRSLEKSGDIRGKDMREANDLYAHYEFLREGRTIYSATDDALERVNNLFTGDTAFRSHVIGMTKKTNPMWERFSGSRPVNEFGDDYLAVNMSFENGFMNQFSSWSGIKDFAKQWDPRTGRRNMEDYTTFSAYMSYIPYRLQDALGSVGLGLSDASMGNRLQMWSSLLLKRFLPVVAIPTYADYIDDKSEQLTGQSISDRWEIYKATTELNKAAARDATGQTEVLKRRMMLHPGAEHFSGGPEVYLPGFGRASATRLAGFIATGGSPVDERDAYSQEEMYDYYQNGSDEVRKGRWWLFGSKGAYRGERITEFRPNSYRLAMSDWEYTSVTSTMQERWEHSAFPTLENPLGVARNLFNSEEDKYWWENKHYYDRPYMLTGSLFNPNTMVFGDLGNAALGQVVKPVRQMHTEYWSDPVLVQEQADQLAERPADPILTKVSPGGRMEHVVQATPDQYGAYFDSSRPQQTVSSQAMANIEDGKARLAESKAGSYPTRYFISNELDNNGSATGAYVMQDAATSSTIYVPSNVAKQNMPINKMFAMAAEPVPTVDTKPRAMFDQDFVYRQEVVNRKLRNLQDPTSLEWQSQEAFENWTEPLGIYKYAAEELIGGDPYKNKMIIQKADAATNISNAFWESNLGGAGGDVSEIMRRFIRRDSGQLDTFNPIRNTMPDWMPGGGYFINFQTGDPYQKIAHGEYRLPGEAYERVNQLHPDETGNYGAFDKFKILADVAPWSDEYRYWKDYVEDNNKDTELRRQAAIIKDQVSKRKAKYEFTDYRFKDNDIEKQKVTVSKFLDDYTFLTEEMPDTPIRLAGMKYQAKAEGVLQSYFKVGDKVTIGISADPSRRSSDDSYNTMRAVVFKGLENVNQTIIRNGQMRENETDFTAAGVHARFTKGEIAQGRRWETMAHADTFLNSKFLPVRTALEEYERDHIYGKDWATWDNFMVDDYVVPAYQSGIRGNVLFAAGAGLMFSALPAIFMFGRGKSGFRHLKIMGATSAAFAAGSIWRSAHEAQTGETWIPERRRKEQDINEYFDVLKYMKFSGLYERAKEELHQQGIDVEAIANDRDMKKEMNKAKRQELQDEKRNLYLNQPAGWEDRKAEINAQLNLITEDRDEMYLPNAVLQALNYKEQAETTLYAVDPYEDRMKVMRSMPYKDKWFFNEFAEARLQDQQRILDLVPDNEGRVLKALWGYELEDQVPLEEYFKDKFLPDENWVGWQPDVNLEDYQVKAVQDAGIDLSDYNFWDDDVQSAAMLPDMYEGGNGPGKSNFRGYRDMQRNIREVLNGQGLWDVQVTVTPASDGGSRINMDYQEDRSREIDSYLKYNMDSIV